MKRLLLPWSEIGGNIIQKGLASQALSGVRVAELAVQLNRERWGYHVAVRYRLASDNLSGQEKTRALVFDQSNLILPVLGARSSVEVLPRLPSTNLRPKGKLPPLRLREAGSWDGVELTLEFQWHYQRPASNGEDIAPCLVIPDLIPRVFPDRAYDWNKASYRQPKVTLEGNIADGLEVAGLAARAGEQRSSSAQELIQAVLIGTSPRPLVTDSASNESVVLSPRFALGLSSEARARCITLAQRILGYLTTLLGSASGIRLCVLTLEELRGVARIPSGAAVVASPADFAVTETHAVPADVRLARRIAAVWWGGGCRVVGPLAREIESGLRAAMGLLWSEEVGEDEQLSHQLSWYRGLTRRPVLTDHWYVAQGYAAPRMTGLIALTVYEGCRGTGAMREILGQLSKQSWGCLVPSPVIAQGLGISDLLSKY